MKQLHLFADERTLYFCTFCGGGTGTKDHCPSKVFLEKPYPENLPTVPSCRRCNISFSKDEEYVACLIECLSSRTKKDFRSIRPNIHNILNRKHVMAKQISSQIQNLSITEILDTNFQRIGRVIVKLALGHALYELHENLSSRSPLVSIGTIEAMNLEEINSFETNIQNTVWPEVGSRMMKRLISNIDLDYGGWLTVQKNIYRYSAVVSDFIEVRIVINEYFACIIRWDVE